MRIVAALLLVVALAACGSGPAPAAPETGGAFPVTIKHVFGETTIEREPQRIVALGVTDADAVLALGVTPIAVTGYKYYPETGLGPWAQALVTGEQPVRLESDSAPNLEQIASLNPDLIIAVSAGIDEAVYGKLAGIAPTIARAEAKTAYTVPRAEATRLIAQAMGEVAAGEELLKRADDAYAQAIAANPAFAGKSAAIVLPYDGKYGAYFPGDGRGRVITELGLHVPQGIAALDNGTTFFTEVSREQVSLLDGDLLVMLADAPAARQFVDTDPILQSLPVVKEGRMVIPDLDTRGAITSNSVISVPFALERLVPALRDALN